MPSEIREVPEEPEVLVAMIREHLRAADKVRASDSVLALGHDRSATRLIEKLSRLVLPKAEAIARKLLGKSYELHSEGVVEIFVELNRVVRSTDTRAGLEFCFDATFYRIAVDACRRARSANQRISGKGGGHISVESLDESIENDEGEPGETATQLLVDPTSLKGYFAFLGEQALESIAHRIPDRQLVVLTLRLQGHEYKAIADKLGIHRDTASSDFEKVSRFIQANVTTGCGGNR